MFSVDDINEMQKTIERKDRIIKVLKERVRQWVKEYNILDEIIEMYKMSENEANEIIAELKAENERLKAELEPYKHPDVITLLTNWRTGELDRTHNKIANERDKYKTCLQEIKEIAEKEIYMKQNSSMDRILELTKAEEE